MNELLQWMHPYWLGFVMGLLFGYIKWKDYK